MYPKISIIMVVRNAEKTIQKSIESVLSQTYPNKELIIIDGVSTDKTIQIIEKFSSDSLQLISEPDNGIYDAMNKGIQYSKGQWLYFLGSDDVFYDKESLKIISVHLQNEHLDFVYGNVISTKFRGKYNGEFDYPKLLSRNIAHQSIFYNRIVFEIIGKYNIKYKTHADWDLNLRCFENIEIKKRYIDTVVAEFAAGGASKNYDKVFLIESLLPKKIQFWYKNRNKIGVLKFDEFWRLLRNSDARSLSQLPHLHNNISYPTFIFIILKWHNKLSNRIINNGLMSKLFMFFCYTTCKFRKKI